MIHSLRYHNRRGAAVHETLPSDTAIRTHWMRCQHTLTIDSHAEHTNIIIAVFAQCRLPDLSRCICIVVGIVCGITIQVELPFTCASFARPINVNLYGGVQRVPMPVPEILDSLAGQSTQALFDE